MAEMTNEQILEMVKKKLAEKNEVIKEQQTQIVELENQILDLEQKLRSFEAAKSERDSLVDDLTSLLE